MSAKVLCLRIFFCCLKEVYRIQFFLGIYTDGHTFVCTDSKNDGIKTFLFQTFNIFNISVIYKFCSVCFCNLHIFCDCFVINTEGRDHVANRSAKMLFFVKYGNVCSTFCKECGTGNTSRAATYDGNFLAAVSFCFQPTQNTVISAFCCLQFGTADSNRLFIEVSGTFAHTSVVTQGTCHKRKRVFIKNNL